MTFWASIEDQAEREAIQWESTQPRAEEQGPLGRTYGGDE